MNNFESRDVVEMIQENEAIKMTTENEGEWIRCWNPVEVMQ